MPEWSSCGVGKVLQQFVLFILLFTLGLYLLQSRMIYFPHRYSAAHLEYAKKFVRTLEFKTAQGAQHAYYLPPPSGRLNALWVCFHGNGANALDWLDYMKDAGLQESGFLLVEYPGYGASGGKPSPDTILEVSEGALNALQAALGSAELRSNLNLLGLSIGTGPALELAVRHDVRRMVLLAPYTSLLDMAKRQVGVPLAYLLKHRFDNQARLAELSKRSMRPEVTIFHGDSDEIVPNSMGRALSDRYRDFVRYTELKDCDHNGILDKGREMVYAELAKAEKS